MEISVTQLDNLRKRLTDDQRAILNAIWQHYCGQKEQRKEERWILVRVLHHGFGKTAVRLALEKLGGSIVFEGRDNAGKDRYQLTFLGVLLTDQGEEAEQLLVRYLEYVRDRFVSDPEIDMIKSQEIEAALGLTAYQSRFLKQLIQLSSLWSRSATFDDEAWNAGVPHDVDEFPSIQDFRSYVRQHALKGFDPAMPINGSERISYLLRRSQEDRPSDEFWFISNPDVQRQLAADWQEAQRVHQAKAWKSCVILCGGILEGMLLDVLRQDEQQAREVYQRLRKKPPPDLTGWYLVDLVDVAKETGILAKGTDHLSHAIREFRNLIHPGRQIREKVKLTEEEADIALSVVRICLRELAALRGGEKRET